MKRKPRPASPPSVSEVIATLKGLGSEKARWDMRERYGIIGVTASTAFGVGMAAIRDVATGTKSSDRAANHALALALWSHGGPGLYEARMVAIFIDEPTLVTARQMDRWAKDFDTWAICDTACFTLFDRVPADLAFSRVDVWAKSQSLFVKRAALALLACLALHTKESSPQIEMRFAEYVPIADLASADDRTFIKKGASWAMRGIATRNAPLRAKVLTLAASMAKSLDPARRWVGKDVLRQLKAT